MKKNCKRVIKALILITLCVICCMEFGLSAETVIYTVSLCLSTAFSLLIFSLILRLMAKS